VDARLTGAMFWTGRWLERATQAFTHRLSPRPGRAGACVSLDHLVGESEQLRWHGDAESFSGFKVDHQFELGRLFHRDVGWLRPAQNLVSKIGGTPVQVQEARPVGQQPSRFDELGTL
jgi:hypothetical protein